MTKIVMSFMSALHTATGRPLRHSRLHNKPSILVQLAAFVFLLFLRSQTTVDGQLSKDDIVADEVVAGCSATRSNLYGCRLFMYRCA